jgi:hypothetical protein
MPIIQFGLPSFKIASGHLAYAQSGGSARILQNFSATQCDAVRKLAGIRTQFGRYLAARNSNLHPGRGRTGLP